MNQSALLVAIRSLVLAVTVGMTGMPKVSGIVGIVMVYVYGNFVRRTTMMIVKKMVPIMETPLNNNNYCEVLMHISNFYLCIEVGLCYMYNSVLPYKYMYLPL